MADNRDFSERIVAVQPRLLRFCQNLARSYLSDPEGARDLCQETLTRGLRRQDGFREEADLNTWLCQIAKNIAKDQIRSLRSLKRSCAGIEPLPDDDERLGLSAAVRHDEENRLVHSLDLASALADANPSTARMLRLFGEGYSYLEISYMLGVPQGTVKSRIYRFRDCFLQQQ